MKTDNIRLEATTGRALVADFGIAGLVRGAAALDGGEGSVQSLTTDLGLAREVAQQVARLLEAEREIEKELG